MWKQGKQEGCIVFANKSVVTLWYKIKEHNLTWPFVVGRQWWDTQFLVLSLTVNGEKKDLKMNLNIQCLLLTFPCFCSRLSALPTTQNAEKYCFPELLDVMCISSIIITCKKNPETPPPCNGTSLKLSFPPRFSLSAVVVTAWLVKAYVVTAECLLKPAKQYTKVGISTWKSRSKMSGSFALTR